MVSAYNVFVSDRQRWRASRPIRGLPLVAFLCCTFASPVLSANALDKAWEQYSGPPRNMPTRNTVVEIETDFGIFHMPIGYYSYPGTLPHIELPPDGSGLHRYKSDDIEFQFSMPDGHQNAALHWFRPGDDGADRIGIDPRRYVVWIMRMDRPQPGDRSAETKVLDSDIPPDRLVSAVVDRLNAYHIGWTRSPVDHERVGIALGCSANVPERGSSGICQGHIFIKTQGVDLQFQFQVERLGDVFAIVQETLKLMGDWQIKRQK